MSKNSFFSYKNNQLHVEQVSLQKILTQVGTPAYVYSYGALKKHYQDYAQAFRGLKHLICYSMKCNSNLAIVNAFVKLGSGVDIVSQGELYRALKAGADPQKIVFAGVGKTKEEIAYAIQKNILMFNVESEQELAAIDEVAQSLKKKAPVALRVNPNIDPKTHPYITTGMKKSKFGIQYEDALTVYQEAQKRRGLEIIGIDCHIGSQLTQVKPFVDALKKVLQLIDQIQGLGIQLRYLDLGGGLGIQYQKEKPPTPQQYANALKKALKGYDLTLILEPGRSLMGNAGLLATQVLYTKDRDQKRFLIVDAAMNDLIRPAFYQSYHEILPLKRQRRKSEVVDVVGPICETGDFLATDRKLPHFEAGEALAVLSAGAYGFAMASHYNSRPKVPEVLVKGNRFFVIREREKIQALMRGEVIPKGL